LTGDVAFESLLLGYPTISLSDYWHKHGLIVDGLYGPHHLEHSFTTYSDISCLSQSTQDPVNDLFKAFSTKLACQPLFRGASKSRLDEISANTILEHSSKSFVGNCISCLQPGL
jgi:hypothetical protein